MPLIDDGSYAIIYIGVLEYQYINRIKFKETQNSNTFLVLGFDYV